MLRLTIEAQTPQAVLLKVHGKIASDAVNILEVEGRRIRTSGRQLVLQLDAVDFIDAAGLVLLQRWAGPQLALRGGSEFLRRLLGSKNLETRS